MHYSENQELLARNYFNLILSFKSYVRLLFRLASSLM